MSEEMERIDRLSGDALSQHEALVAEYRANHRQQQPTDRGDLFSAIGQFEEALPGWWWSVCVCSLTRDASCGPDIAGPDAHLLSIRGFDDGFHCDDPDGTLASSLRDVMRQALEAKRSTIKPSDGGA